MPLWLQTRAASVVSAEIPWGDDPFATNAPPAAAVQANSDPWAVNDNIIEIWCHEYTVDNGSESQFCSRCRTGPESF